MDLTLPGAKQAQIAHFNFHTARAFDEILKRKTGQISVEGIASEGWRRFVLRSHVGLAPSRIGRFTDR